MVKHRACQPSHTITPPINQATATHLLLFPPPSSSSPPRPQPPVVDTGRKKKDKGHLMIVEQHATGQNFQHRTKLINRSPPSPPAPPTDGQRKDSTLPPYPRPRPTCYATIWGEGGKEGPAAALFLAAPPSPPSACVAPVQSIPHHRPSIHHPHHPKTRNSRRPFRLLSALQPRLLRR